MLHQQSRTCAQGISGETAAKFCATGLVAIGDSDEEHSSALGYEGCEMYEKKKPEIALDF